MDAWLAKDSAEHAATQAAESLVSKPKVSKLNKSIALNQTGYGAIQRVHLGPLNHTFPALYFPGSPLGVENHCFGPLAQSVSFRRRPVPR